MRSIIDILEITIKHLYSKYIYLPLLVSLLIISCTSVNSISKDFEEIIILGSWSEDKINNLIDSSKRYKTPSERIDFISGKFLNTKYVDHTLTGDIKTSEVFTINLDGLDCFTYLDYVQALTISNNFEDFKKNLIKIRYNNAIVDFKKRNHFFTDWAFNNSKYIFDATKNISTTNASTVIKYLNKKNENDVYLEGIAPKKREIHYIPSKEVDTEVLNNLKTGDYIGIYTNLKGLDVTHTGIAIKKGDELFFRHASSKSSNMKVVDEKLLEYIEKKPGIIILRTL